MNAAARKVNTYLAVLLITIAGAGAALIIIGVARRDADRIASPGTAASYAPLQNSILNGKR